MVDLVMWFSYGMNEHRSQIRLEVSTMLQIQNSQEKEWQICLKVKAPDQIIALREAIVKLNSAEQVLTGSAVVSVVPSVNIGGRKKRGPLSEEHKRKISLAKMGKKRKAN
jgi:hypothetical protein